MKPYLPLLLIATGGALGALARYGLGGLAQGDRTGFPYGTLLVNLLGCLIIGFLGYWTEVGIARPELRLALGIGFLGAFTTFSTFSLETLNLYLKHSPLTALLYVTLSLFGCLVMATTGYLTARIIWRP